MKKLDLFEDFFDPKENDWDFRVRVESNELQEILDKMGSFQDETKDPEGRFAFDPTIVGPELLKAFKPSTDGELYLGRYRGYPEMYLRYWGDRKGDEKEIEGLATKIKARVGGTPKEIMLSWNYIDIFNLIERYSISYIDEAYYLLHRKT